MDILFLLVPLSVLLALSVMGVLAWAVWAGQFEELDTQADRILMESPEPASVSGPSAGFNTASLIHINMPAGDAQDTGP